jgi:hypothetical protein
MDLKLRDGCGADAIRDYPELSLEFVLVAEDGIEPSTLGL